MLAVSRAFGDFEFKKNPKLPYDQQMVICKPDIEAYGRTKRDEFILVACDGIWENFPKSSLVIKEIREDKAYEKGDYCQMLENLFNKLIAPNEQNSFGMDNMTALFIKLNKNHKKL
jgi:protein phosphatase PTC2/3